MQSEEAIELNLKTYTPVKDNICPYLTAGGFQCVHPKGGQLILWWRPTLYNFEQPPPPTPHPRTKTQNPRKLDNHSH